MENRNFLICVKKKGDEEGIRFRGGEDGKDKEKRGGGTEGGGEGEEAVRRGRVCRMGGAS